MTKLPLIAALALFSPVAATAQTVTLPHTYANPIDIDYRYNFEQMQDGVSYRTGADPAVVNHNGSYYLFQTLADGYWKSDDLVTWTFITPSRWPMEGIVAPAVVSDGKTLYIMPSHTRTSTLFKTDDPASGKLDFWVRRTPPVPTAVNEGQSEENLGPDKVQPSPWDPGLFIDDDKQWYMYWGSSNVFPLYVIKVQPDPFKYIGTPTHLYKLDPEHHGWERFGQDHSGKLPNGTPINPFIEGAWMTKVSGRYYLQYGAPGTEYNAYANGTYVSDKPMGPFTYADYNPVAYKPGGFVQGAGHGSSFADKYGNYWNTGTPWIGYNWTFERRIDLLPTKFYADGQMAVSARFGDFPHYAPTSKIDDPESLFTGWMLLSYRAKVVASSTMAVPADAKAGLTFDAANISDENPRTFWVAAANEAGQSVTLDLGAKKTLRAVQVNYADYKSGKFGDGPDIYTEFKLQSSVDGQTWSPLAKTEDNPAQGRPRRDRPNAYFELPAPVKARYVRYVHGHVGAANLAISDIRIFGTDGGKNPQTPAKVAATRAVDQRDATVTWKRVTGAVGYNVRFGIRPDRLTLTYQVFADDPRVGKLDLRSLNEGVTYYVAVEAFNQAGVSKLSRVTKVR